MLSALWKEDPSDTSLQNLHLNVFLGIFVALPTERCQLSMIVQATKEIRRLVLCGIFCPHIYTYVTELFIDIA